MIQQLKRWLPLVIVIFCSYSYADEAGYKSPEFIEGAETIDLIKAKELHAQGVLFVDVRSPRQFKKRHIPGAAHLYIKDNFTETKLLELISKDQPFVVYCNGIHCSLSHKAIRKALAWGFTNAKYFRAGFRAWRLDGNTYETGL